MLTRFIWNSRKIKMRALLLWLYHFHYFYFFSFSLKYSCTYYVHILYLYYNIYRSSLSHSICWFLPFTIAIFSFICHNFINESISYIYIIHVIRSMASSNSVSNYDYMRKWKIIYILWNLILPFVFGFLFVGGNVESRRRHHHKSIHSLCVVKHVNDAR